METSCALDGSAKSFALIELIMAPVETTEALRTFVPTPMGGRALSLRTAFSQGSQGSQGPQGLGRRG